MKVGPIGVLAALALAATACAGGDSVARTDGTTPPETAPTATTETEPQPRRLTLNVYFVREERIAAGQRQVEATQAVGAAALRSLLEGPNGVERAAGMWSEIPQGTRVLGLAIANGVATVDLSREFESGGGSASMLARVAQVVHTLTQFPTVERVRFRLDGRAVEAIGGEGVVVDPPVDRADFEQIAPAILVEAPGLGASAASPLTVRGTANTFEATLSLRVVDAQGRTLVDRFFTATSGSGTRGTFEATLEFTARTDGPGTLVAYERSAEDGSEINVVRIPLQLRR